MLRNVIKKAFDIRDGEFRISFLMQAYIFLIIASLLIFKPTVNALFLSELGIENLPFAYLLVALAAIISSYFYSKALLRISLNSVIEITLLVSIVLLLSLAVLSKLGLLSGWMLYLFYVWVAIHAVLSASQFWVLANLVYNAREAKRLFGFIGSGAILGGIFGGYLTSLLAPLIGNENLFFVAAGLLFFCIPLLKRIWKARGENPSSFKQKKAAVPLAERSLTLIKNSKHLTYIAGIVAMSVLVAKLVDYLFNDFASAAIEDPDELASFFGFWFSTFNLLSLGVQLFFTHRVVGIWGVGFSLMLLPLGIFAGCMLFFVFPELGIVIFIKAVDGTLKQSIHKSAIELLSLPLPFDLKNKTKSFIDVVVDSIATGIAGFILIFVVKGLELPSIYISGIIIALVGVWAFFIVKVRREYFRTFRENLTLITDKSEKIKPVPKKVSVVKGMRSVFQHGSETQILFMLKKLNEINDTRLVEDVQKLLSHPSNKVRTAAIQNMYFLNSDSVVTEVSELLNSNDDALILATLEYVLLHASRNSYFVYDTYLDHRNIQISNAALLCLARESRDNAELQQAYQLKERILKKIERVAEFPNDLSSLKMLLQSIGDANLQEFNAFLVQHLRSKKPEVVQTAIAAVGNTRHNSLIPELLTFLPDKKYRKTAEDALLQYGVQILPILQKTVQERSVPIKVCRYIPMAMEAFNNQEAVHELLQLLSDKDLSIRLEVIRSLSALRTKSPHLKFNQYKVVATIFDECRLYHQTLSAMHTQIIISYRNRKKTRLPVSDEERDARASLLELLERRLEAGLERIFKLLELKYRQKDVAIAYAGIRSQKQEAQANAIEFLDNLLTGDLKKKLLPIIEDTVLDVTSEEVLQHIKHRIPSEMECFQLLLDANDLKIKLAVLYLIRKQGDPKYIPLAEKYLDNDDLKLRTFATEAIHELNNTPNPF
jgi:AAA family ATP:ADP antiporter